MAHAKRRSTPQRRVILETLRGVSTHPTAAEIHAEVRGSLPSISLGTVYRNLEVLCEDGLVRKLTLAGADARYDGLPDAHDHVRCTACGALRDFVDGRGLPTLRLPVEAGGFLIQGYRLEFQGICPDCRPGGPSSAEAGGS